MLDKPIRRIIDPWLKQAGIALASRGVTANQVTWLGFALGVGAAAAIVFGAFFAAVALLIASRICDGLDGAVAQASNSTDLGGFLDIVLDFAFYGMIPLAFVLYDPIANGTAGALLLFSFYMTGSSFLAFSIIAEKRSMTTVDWGKKSIYYIGGIAEGSETIGFFVLLCIIPNYFSVAAYVFSFICIITAISRLILAYQVFDDKIE